VALDQASYTIWRGGTCDELSNSMGREELGMIVLEDGMEGASVGVCGCFYYLPLP